VNYLIVTNLLHLFHDITKKQIQTISLNQHLTNNALKVYSPAVGPLGLQPLGNIAQL